MKVLLGRCRSVVGFVGVHVQYVHVFSTLFGKAASIDHFDSFKF